MERLTKTYLFQKEKVKTFHYQGCCQTAIRKRQKTMLNEFAAELEIPQTMITINRMVGTWDQSVEYCSKKESSVSGVYTNLVFYSGEDIKILDEEANRFPWQADIIEKLIDESTHEYKVSDDRTITWIEDTKGGSGKSKLVKWFCSRFNNSVKISFGSSNQLRSALISAGRQRVYFIDIPRTLGTDDSIESLLSATEDLLNGYIVSAFYGTYQMMMLDPPHVIVFSNTPCPIKIMSMDRWEIFRIDPVTKELDKVHGVWTQ